MVNKRRTKQDLTDNLLSDLAAGQRARVNSPADLVVEPEQDPSSAGVAQEISRSLEETEQQVLRKVAKISEDTNGNSWQIARQIVQNFEPVPWFIWRLSNFVLGKPGKINAVNEGLVFGMRRLLFAAASDDVLGEGRKVNDTKTALKVVEPDVIAAVSVIHACCRKLGSSQFERIWRPILDDAILRAKLGFYVGEQCPEFGAGRGMLAGFAGRVGLVLQIVSGDLDRARIALEKLASGAPIKEIGLKLYDCEPLQVSAMLLSAAGCGRDAAFGVVSFATKDSLAVAENDEQRRWLAAFSVTEYLRTGDNADLNEQYWNLLGFESEKDRDEMKEQAKRILRRGHGLSWVI